MMNNNETTNRFENICISGSLDDSDYEGGLDAIEQQRSLDRASKPELDPLFIGIHD